MTRPLHVRQCRILPRVQRFVVLLLVLATLSSPTLAANPLLGHASQYSYDPASLNTTIRHGGWRRTQSAACAALGDVVNAFFATFTDGRTRTVISTQSQGYYCHMNCVFSPACPTCPVQNLTLSGTLSTLPTEDHFQRNPKVCRPNGGNPIYPLEGSKRQVEPLGFSVAPDVTLAAVFDSLAKVPTFGQEVSFSTQAIPSFGSLWESNLHKSLALQQGSAGLRAIHASRGAGTWISFTYQGGGTYAPSADIDDRITAITGGWRYYDAAASALETYDSQGQLNSIHYARGGSLSFTYSTENSPTAPAVGLLTGVADSFGRSIGFEYEAGPGGEPPRVVRVTSSEGRSTAVGYDAAGNLQSLTWPDGRRRLFIYDAPGLPWALSGVRDENERRHSAYGYDAQGRAVSTELAGGVSRFTATHSAPAVWRTDETVASNLLRWDHYLQPPTDPKMTDPLGQSIAFGTQMVHGTARMTSRSQAAGSGCQAGNMSVGYDANGNASTVDDFDGHRACRSFNTTRNLETVGIEGLAPSQACAEVLGSAASLPAGSRKTSTEWHPNWRLRTALAEPGRITRYVYNGAGATCAPAGSALPDTKPLALVCTRIEQATTDLNGAAGFGAAAAPTVPQRIYTWTYNELGQVLTEKDPLNNTTHYEYYQLPSFSGAGPDAEGYSKGDLKQVTNAAGHVTQYTKYNRAGQVLEMKDPNNVTTTYTYDARKRLLSKSVGGRTTAYDYWPTGLLMQVTAADGSYTVYSYDDAHRLTSVRDNLGNRIDYDLDAAGNRKGEKVLDPSGALRRQIDRVFDALGRVEKTTGRE